MPGQVPPSYNQPVYGAQPVGYAQPQPVVMAAQPVVMAQPVYGQQPVVVQPGTRIGGGAPTTTKFETNPVEHRCQFCMQDIKTNTYYVTTMTTYICCIVIFLLG